jgi:hypothetical protein
MADQIHRASTELSVIVPEVWSSTYYDVLLENLPFRELVDDSYEGAITSLGDTVRISTFPEFDEAADIAEDQRNDADAITVTQQSLIINHLIAKDFIVTNVAMLQSLPAMDKLRDLAIFSIQKKINSIIVADIIPSASTPDHSIAFDSGTTLALADILEGKELLDAQDVPMANRSMVMGAAQLNDIFSISGFTSSEFLVSGAPVQTGELPSALVGFMPQFASGVGNVVYQFHRSFMTFAAQKGISVTEYDLGVDGTRARRINVDTLVGNRQLDNLRVVTIG